MSGSHLVIQLKREHYGALGVRLEHMRYAKTLTDDLATDDLRDRDMCPSVIDRRINDACRFTTTCLKGWKRPVPNSPSGSMRAGATPDA